MKPMCSLRQWAICLSLSWRRLAPSTSISPSVGLSMAAIRCSSVDLPEPEGPMRATKSPRRISISTLSSATTWNSSRTNSLLNWRVLTIISSIVFLRASFFFYALAIFQIGRRIHDQVFAADEAAFDQHSTVGTAAGGDGALARGAVDDNEDAAVRDGVGRHDNDALRGF